MAVKSYRAAVSAVDKERTRLVASYVRRLRATLPRTFPVEALQWFLAWNTRVDHISQSSQPDGFEGWVEKLFDGEEYYLWFYRGRLEAMTRGKMCGWQSPNDIEVSFEDLAIAWKPYMDMRVETRLDHSLTVTPPISQILVHCSIR